MIFSILHPSARPDKWRAVYDEWIAKAANPKNVEYILCADERWGFKGFTKTCAGSKPPFDFKGKIVWNEARRCYVDSVNTAARAATGNILIVIADDQFPCQDWDVELLKVSVPTEHFLRGEWVMEVSTGTVKERERGIIVMPILSRARYERLGYVFYPEYESMYADNDFAEHAKQDGIVIDARHLMFPHRHPLIPLQTAALANGQPISAAFGEFIAMADDAYKAQNRMEAYVAGQQIFERRRANHFPIPIIKQRISEFVNELDRRNKEAFPSKPRRIFALAAPGKQFSSAWVSAVLGIQQYLIERGFAVFVHQAYSSIAAYTRQVILESILQQQPQPELVLWLDDDNILSVENLKLLLEDMEKNPDMESVAGWYWIDAQDGTFHTSVGVTNDAGNLAFAGSDIAEVDGLVQVSWHGFGGVLMRFETLQKSGPQPFASIPAPNSRWGMTGEDVSFCIHALERSGCKFWIDPRVFLPHLKFGAIGPPSRRQPARPDPVIVATLRVKNESRNIGGCIESLRPLCKTILVLDDHSTDDTAFLAEELGATVYASAFSDRDEGRDRQFLLERAREAKADWIFAIDADEMLDERDVPTLLDALRMTAADALHLRWMHVWNSPDQIRVDGIYGQGSPPRLYRVTPSLELASMSNGVHTWPVATLQRAMVEVRLWHWGYYERAERIRKYQWYNQVDPDNQAEDCYRHLVQGDIPEVPADAKLMKAGPLKLEKIKISETACGPELEKKR